MFKSKSLTTTFVFTCTALKAGQISNQTNQQNKQTKIYTSFIYVYVYPCLPLIMRHLSRKLSRTFSLVQWSSSLICPQMVKSCHIISQQFIHQQKATNQHHQLQQEQQHCQRLDVERDTSRLETHKTQFHHQRFQQANVKRMSSTLPTASMNTATRTIRLYCDVLYHTQAITPAKTSQNRRRHQIRDSIV